MGVTGLWKVVEHCARPTKIETLNKKRLAVDASIWIYQFLKAVRDKEGNALRNSHVVGFFRRICKLLFIGILPVFVFDGGAPALKRQTIIARKTRREGRREDAAQTASKLLAREMQRLAEEEEQRRKDAAQQRLHQRHHRDDDEAIPRDFVYAEELNMTEQEVQQTRKFKKTDQYHLPELSTSIAEMGGPDDPRVMSLQELENYARQFDTGEDINIYDFSKIDFDSPFFVSLPASDRYNILNAARLRSRLRMGHSKDQLDAMFPDRMAFSKFQIERVRERNELTQRLMSINGMNEGGLFGLDGSGRIAGEKGREYVLVRNDGVEGGWALGVVSNKDEGKESQPIDIEKEERLQQEMDQDDDDDDDDMDNDFEDVPIEGLNRLPKLPPDASHSARTRRDRRRRRRGYQANGRSSPAPALAGAESNDGALFVQDENEGTQSGTEDNNDLFGSDTDREQLDHAIAMSLQQEAGSEEGERDLNSRLNAFQQSRAEEARPLPKASGKATAHILNLRAGKTAPKAASFDGDEQTDNEDSDEDVDIVQALAVSSTHGRQGKAAVKSVLKSPAAAAAPAIKPKAASGFDGPLPFEKLDLGSSLLGKKKMQDIKAKEEGGFERPTDKKKETQPLPPWFAGNINESIRAQRELEQIDRRQVKDFDDAQKFEFEQPSPLQRADTGLVIDLEDETPQNDDKEIELHHEKPAQGAGTLRAQDGEGKADTMGEIADVMRAVPPAKQIPPTSNQPPFPADGKSQTGDVDDAGTEVISEHVSPATESAFHVEPEIISKPPSATEAEDSDRPVEWSDSDHEGKALAEQSTVDDIQAREAHEDVSGPVPESSSSRSASADGEFEDVDMTAAAESEGSVGQAGQQNQESKPEPMTASHTSGLADQNALIPDDDGENFGYYTDSEDERLMMDLADEATEHARFGAQLSGNKTQPQIQAEYESEMKQLRSQQKKDRRDADEVTQIMIQECQQLLRLFGLPYVTAPMEAEAQCAELVRLGLVDGIVTDDSDCFLFGGTRIYKNMFNQAKLVECYLAPDLEKEYDLSRQKLIDIAQLLGSDYTEGLSGIGHVKALEILSEFGTLTEFRDWWTQVQTEQHVQSVRTAAAAAAGQTQETTAFRRKFRKAHLNKLFLPPTFPDPRVAAAYLRPEVDSDPSEFRWGVPDLGALRAFLSATIGWSAERTDEVLVPVIRDMNRREAEGTQSNITAFIKGASGVGGYAPRERLEVGSKRAGTALDRMAKRARAKGR